MLLAEAVGLHEEFVRLILVDIHKLLSIDVDELLLLFLLLNLCLGFVDLVRKVLVFRNVD